VIDVKHNIRNWKSLVDSTSDLTAIVGCNKNRRVHTKLLAATIDAFQGFLYFCGCVGLA
jgi:hypothetical protein